MIDGPDLARSGVIIALKIVFPLALNPQEYGSGLPWILTGTIHLAASSSHMPPPRFSPTGLNCT